MLYTKLKEKLTGGSMNPYRNMGRLSRGVSSFLSEIVSFKSLKVVVSYYESTISDVVSKAEYNIVLSDEMKKLMEITGEEEGRVIIKDIDENTVRVYPKYDCNLAGYQTWMGHDFYYIFYNNKIVNKFVHNRGNCCFCVGEIENPIGIYQNKYLIAERGDDYVLVDPYGHVVKLGYLIQPESGRDDHKKVRMRDNKLLLEEYVYYDCDHHHGGWESREIDLDEGVAKIPYIVAVELVKEILEKHLNGLYYVRGVNYSSSRIPITENGVIKMQLVVNAYKKARRGPTENCSFTQEIEITIPDDKNRIDLRFVKKDGEMSIFDILSNPSGIMNNISELANNHFGFLIEG